MKLTFGKLEIQGFKAFLKPQTLDFSALGPGLHFIRGKNNRPRLGSNGAAKSTILDAAVWCLFGQTVAGLRNPDVKPWRHKAKTSVAWQLKIDNQAYLVKRTIDPNSLTINGESVGPDDLTKLLQLSLSTFSNAIFLGQEQDFFLDLKPAQKLREFFTILPSLTRWADRSMLAGRVATELRDRLAQLQYQLARKESAIAEFEGLMETSSKRAEGWQKERETYLTEQDRAIARLKDELAGSIQHRDAADLVYDGAMAEAQTLRKEIDAMQAPMADLRRARQELAQLPKTGTCPTCGQPLKGTRLAEHKRELEGRVAAMQLTETRLQASQGHLEGFEKKARVAKTEFDLHALQVTKLEAQISSLGNLVRDWAGRSNPYLVEVRELRKKRDAANAAKDELASQAARLNARIERTQYWVKGFKDLQLYLVEEILHELELVTNSVLIDVGLEDWAMEYQIEKETKSGTVQRGLSVLIRSPDTPRPVRWECYSGGERQRLRLAASLALSEVLLAHAGVVPSMIALDEPSPNLSDEGMDDLCAYLAERCRTLDQQCFLIDHLVSPNSNFASTIEVEKDRMGTSSIKVPEYP